MLDGNVLLRQKRDEVPKGTLSCPDRIMEFFYQLRHYEGSHLLLSVCGQKLIQQTLSKGPYQAKKQCTARCSQRVAQRKGTALSEKGMYRTLLACGSAEKHVTKEIVPMSEIVSASRPRTNRTAPAVR